MGARYLDPKYSRWISVDPALGEYIPHAPVNDEAKKHNQNLPGMGGLFNSVNLSLFHYGANNPVRYVDPDGRELRDKETKKAITDSFKSDQFGRELLYHYLYGNGIDKICNSDTWQDYMRNNEELRLNIGSEVLNHFNDLTVKNELTDKTEYNLTFTFRFHGEMQNTEKMEGYSYLHGSNKNEGDVSVFVYAEIKSDEQAVFYYAITWNDRIDVNENYSSDVQKNNLAKVLSLGNCKEYRLEIFWHDKLTINSNGYEFGD